MGEGDEIRRKQDAIERGDQETAAAILDKHVCAVGERFKNLVDGVRPEKKHWGAG
jgi:DNA-binding GntR family transcriptional regulator